MERKMKILHFIITHKILQNKYLNAYLIVSLLIGLLPVKTDFVTNLGTATRCLVSPLLGFGIISFFVNVIKTVSFSTPKLRKTVVSLSGYFLGSFYFITFIPHIISLTTGFGLFPGPYFLTGMLFRLTKIIDN